MKKFTYLLIFLPFISCSDGDLLIENINFEEGTIEFCDDLDSSEDALDRTLFFKIEEDQALILDLEPGLFVNEISNDITSTIGTDTQFTYRLFSDGVDIDYFCDAIPPTTPTVVEEIVAANGQISIATSVDTVTQFNQTFSHRIDIVDITIENSRGERITDEAGFVFGTYLITLENSLRLAFADYTDEEIINCGDNAGVTKVFKSLGDEILSVEIPSELLINEVTTEARTVSLAEAINASFRNTYFDSNPDQNAICTNTLGDTRILNEFSATNGTISVTTVEDATSTADAPVFAHTLTLEGLQFEDIAGNALTAVDALTFGTFTTTPN